MLRFLSIDRPAEYNCRSMQGCPHHQVWVSRSVDLNEFWLSEQFEHLRPLLRNKVRGVARADDRRVISGVIRVVKFGGRRVDALPCCGPRKTLYNRFVR